VLFFILDDVGYGQLSCFGGLVDTPNIDRVAASGLRYANMHTTALCSPSRAWVLTGRNHHSSGVAAIMELATEYPGVDADYAVAGFAYGGPHSSYLAPGNVAVQDDIVAATILGQPVEVVSPAAAVLVPAEPTPAAPDQS
jgi:hypothetical protein